MGIVETFDVIIVGGGPAGLSAGLVLGRCGRRVVIFDHGKYRNARARAMHGYLTRDGTAPGELLTIGREEVRRYGVELRQEEVVQAACEPGRFEVRLNDGSIARSRKLLLATGVCDNVPEIEGLDAMYGVSVHHCPYCDGYEHRGQPIAVLGKGKAATQLALKLKTWTDDLVVCTNGATEMKPQERDRLAHHRIPIRREHVVRLEGTDGKLEQIVFDRGAPLPRSAIFFTLGQKAGCNLPERLGCRMNKAIVTTDIKERTGIPGLFVAGDASKDVQFVIVAAAEGAKAAVCINEELAAEDGLQDPPSPPTTEEAKAAVVVDPSV